VPYNPAGQIAQAPGAYYPKPLARAQAPVIRGQAPEPGPAPASSVLKMPAPEELGIRLGQKAPAQKEQPLDWNQLRAQIEKLGAKSFQLDKHADGYRFACQLPQGSIEGTGRSESEAVQVALAKVRK
jgi:hypothetical protein